jgi:hypothetical protein
MKKIIRLTESDLTKIIKRVINEDKNNGGTVKPKFEEITTNPTIVIKNKKKEKVKEIIESLPSEIIMISIIDCEYADFSGIDVCGFPELDFINLKGTDNNFKQQGYNCFDNSSGDNTFLRLSPEEMIQSMKGPKYRGFRQMK